MILNDGAREFVDEALDLPGGLSSTHSVAVADVNNDGYVDVIVGNYGQINQLILNDGAGGFVSFSSEVKLRARNPFKSLNNEVLCYLVSEWCNLTSYITQDNLICIQLSKFLRLPKTCQKCV